MAGTNSWTGIGREVLDRYLRFEQGGGGGDAGQMGVDVFVNGFEDEFPGDPDDPVAGTYQGYSLEANRASESRPWGGTFGNRPKIHELNQPDAAQVLGWRVVDVLGDRDVKWNFHRFAGTPAELRQLIQNYQAMRFVTGARINFDIWFDFWRKGFIEFNANRGESNYPIAGENQWLRIKEPGRQPRFREWTTPQQRADYGFRIGDYWRDESQEKKSIVISGTDLQLINQVVQYEYQGGGMVAKPEQQIASDVIRYSGIPEITLHFKGIDKSDPQRPKIIEGDKSFRFMGYTDNPAMAQKRSDLELIKQIDIDRIGAKIKAIFGTSPAYNWSKGKKLVVYHDWLQGYHNLRIYCSTYAEGDRLLSNILAIRNLQVDEAFVKYGEAKNPVKAYPPATEIEVLGKKHKTSERLPTVDVTFQYASIYLSTLKKTEYIA